MQTHLYKGFLVGLGMLLLLPACDNSGTNDPPGESDFDRAAMLSNIAHNILMPAYAALQVHTDALNTTVTLFSQNPTTENLQMSRDALKEARLAWQQVSFFQFGPAASVALRGLVNTFPANLDLINANINSGSFVPGSIENIAAGGFPAMGYLLHGEDMTLEETLALFTADQHAQNRLAYARENASFIKSNVDFVVDQWDSEGGNYISTFLSTEKAGADVGSSLGELINALILHIERFTRDGKMGIPAGIRSAGVPRPRAVEALYGGYSVALASANLDAINRLFRGIGLDGMDGPGMDENLAFLDAGDLSLDIITALDESKSAVDSLVDPLETQIEADVNKVIAVFTEMQTLVVLMKVDMASRLGITITFQDNDGD